MSNKQYDDKERIERQQTSSSVIPKATPLPTIINLMTRLQEDSAFLKKFTEAPDKVLIEAGIISHEDREILKSGDLIRVRKLLSRKDS